MGWLSYHVETDDRGKFDRKSELDRRWSQEEHISKDGTHYPELKILKSSMIGSTYYAAIKSTKNNVEQVFAAVSLTSLNNKDYHNFSVKDMDETVGPYQTQCPIGILRLLTETDSEYANSWRQACYEYHNKKKDKNSLQNLPIGTRIKAKIPYDTTIAKKGEEIIFIKCEGYGKRKHSYWYAKGYKWKPNLIGDDYEVLKEV